MFADGQPITDDEEETIDDEERPDESESISEAPTYVSSPSNSFNSNKEDDADDDESISRAETYHSGSTNKENLTETRDSVFSSPRQYQKAESVVSATGSATRRMIERQKQQKAVAASNVASPSPIRRSLLNQSKDSNSKKRVSYANADPPKFVNIYLFSIIFNIMQLLWTNCS